MEASHAAMKIGDTFGALFIGALVTMTIYGITTLQAYFYYVSFPKDSLSVRLLVALIWSLDTLHAVFMCHSVHYYLIDQFGNPVALLNGTWSLFLSIGTNVIIAFIVQCFFTHRIFRLCSPKKRWWVGGVIGFCVFAHFVFGIETVVYLFIKKQFSRLKEVALTSAVPFGITAILSDVLIAATLCVLLDRNRSGFNDTNTIINRLIIFAINRCILTSAMAIIETIVFSVLPNSFYSLAIDFVIGKLYANSLLAVLNSRAKLRGNTQDYTSSTEMSTRFIVAPPFIPNHGTNLGQVRSREAMRRSVTDMEKGEQDFNAMSSTDSRKDSRRLEDGIAL